jgi:multimeric flavodoxin WrbA
MIIAIYGSPRKGGNTDLLMNAFLEPVQLKAEVKRYHISDMLLKPCIACGKCDKTGVCAFKDEIWSLYKDIDEAEGVVLSSPIYFASVSAQLKAFIDRSQAFWARKYLIKQPSCSPQKKGFYISAGAINTDKFFLNSRQVIQTFMLSMDIEYSGDLFFSGADRKGEILGKPGALEAAAQAGMEFIGMLR